MRINKIITAMALAALCLGTAHARDSKFTRHGAGPMYWMAYEQPFVTDKALEEDRFKRNIDWVAENFLPYGFDMICTDGWIEGGQTTNRNGYITKYNSSWKNDWKYWIDYIHSKGMRAGIYYNPLWMTRTAYERNYHIQGSDLRTKDIRGEIGDFNSDLYWVDTDKPGAEEWVKNYVRHFVDLGFDFLRVDFVCWYENAYGTDRYRKLLQWVAEAAGDDIEFSLVMPNCWNNSENELPYADVMRVSEDVFGGGWDFISNRRRGQYQDGWANWGNAFDGFIGFAEHSGRGRLIMDGDFIRLNTCDTDDERQTWVSLMAMTGSPIAIADQYDTGRGFEKFYQNAEILALNKAGFAAKPLSTNNTSALSSIWVGQLPDGDWVCGLFNREDAAETMILNFVRHLGFTEEQANAVEVRDLWAGTEMGVQQKMMRLQVPAHACRVLRVKAPVKRYQVEAAGAYGNAAVVY